MMLLIAGEFNDGALNRPLKKFTALKFKYFSFTFNPIRIYIMRQFSWTRLKRVEKCTRRLWFLCAIINANGGGLWHKSVWSENFLTGA